MPLESGLEVRALAPRQVRGDLRPGGRAGRERATARMAGRARRRAASPVIEGFRLPERTCAMELDLSVLFAAAESTGPVQAPELSAYPLAIQDVA